MKKILLLFFTLCFTLLGQAQISKTVNLTTAGTLFSSLTSTELTTVTNLTVTGKIDVRDLVTMGKATALTVIDLTGANIVAYNGTMGTLGTSCTSYLANTIPENAFSIKITSLTIPTSVTTIGDCAFWECTGLTSITLSSSLTSIGKLAFSDCKGLTTITIPSSVTSIGIQAFDGCTGLKSVTIPNSVTSIGSGAFETCTGLTSITIPPSVISIEDATFDGCTGLRSISIPSSVTSIGSSAFSECIGLTSITIPSSVIAIGSEAFFWSGIRSIVSESAIPAKFVSDAFFGIYTSTCVLYVPVGSKSAYQVADQWKDFKNIIETSNLTALPTITNSTISLYPNPTTDYFQISGIHSNALITIIDLNGKTVLTKQVIDNECISVDTLPKGLYIMKVITNEGTIEREVVKK